MKSIIVSLTIVVVSAMASFADAPTTDKEQSEVYPQLLTPSETKLWTAFNQVRGEQGIVQGKVTQTFLSLKKNPVGNPRAFNGALDTTLQLVALLHIDAVAPDLYDMLDYQLDPATIPMLRDPRGFEFYPAARAFAAVADKNDIESLFLSMQGGTTSEKRLRIYAWIVTEVEGARLARVDVASRLDDETRALKKRQQDNSDYRQNLQKMKQLVDSDEGSYLIRRPTKETPSLTQKPAPK